MEMMQEPSHSESASKSGDDYGSHYERCSTTLIGALGDDESNDHACYKSGAVPSMTHLSFPVGAPPCRIVNTPRQRK
jgi:hypothetical protein